MKYFCKIFIFLLLLSIYLTGTVSAEGNALDMITGVQITCRREETIVTRQYVQPYKISAVLNYLRLLECSGKADTDPERLTGDSFEIILYDACGQRSIYRQRANRFFSKNSGPWVRVSPEQASHLYSLIQAMPTDKERTVAKFEILQQSVYIILYLPFYWLFSFCPLISKFGW